MKNALGALVFLIMGCTHNPASDEKDHLEAKKTTSLHDVPDWSHDVVWYQIFAERFRNGDRTNDPRPQDITGCYPGWVPETWAVTPWGHDWYEPDPYFVEFDNRPDWSGYPISNFNSKAQLRRYGGDLQGVLDQIDYLDLLGITAVYFNPLNDAPSLHKYDPRHWRHIDRNFGPDPDGDIALIEGENPIDPDSWIMTSADQLFVAVIEAFHDRGIRVILDYSFNHTGADFWALNDIRKRQFASDYKDWYWIDSYDVPLSDSNEFAYKGWYNLKGLPEIKEEEYHHMDTLRPYSGNIQSATAKEHIFNVTRRWLDPNGDGDPSDGVDGYRLDVAMELPTDFWKEFRAVVREVNPDAYFVGEVWWKAWPDELADPAPYLEGDMFDAVMNYRWYRAARHYFAAAPNSISTNEFIDSLRSFERGIRPQNRRAMMNVAASHDVPRLATSLYNKNKYKYVPDAAAQKRYKVEKPDSLTRKIQELLLVQQFTFVGAPHIWAGDEMGMWGGDDPNCRKPLIWPDLEFDPEVYGPEGRQSRADEVAFDRNLFLLYQQLIELRQHYPALRRGDIIYYHDTYSDNLLCYTRYYEGDSIDVYINRGSEAMKVPFIRRDRERSLINTEQRGSENGIEFVLQPMSWAIDTP